MNTFLFKQIVSTTLAVAMVLPLSFANQARAAIVEPGFEVETVASGFTLPTAMAFAPDGRIFVAEKGGSVKIVQDGAIFPAPLITLTDINTFGDRGLLGIAVDPGFASNGYLYLSYTYENSPGMNFGGAKTGRIVRVTVVGDTASESSKFVLVGTVGGNAATPSCEDFAVTADCIPSDSSSHSVGGLRFGPDGKLYASLGDGADFSAVDPRALRAQNLDSLAGKVLRVNLDGTGVATNPFFNGDANANISKVYASGVRNMFRFNFRPGTGALFGGDVGWSSWEEINRITAGSNYGWPCWEGNVTTTYNCTASGVTMPTYTYGHSASGAGSITAGAFPANSAYPSQFDNSLFIGDYAQNWIKRVVLDKNNNLSQVVDLVIDDVWPVDLSTGMDGNIYYLDIAFESLNRITHTSGNRKPIVQISAAPTSGLAPLSVAFSSAGSSDPDSDPITFSWNFGDGAASSEANPSHIYTANGSYSAILTITDVNGAQSAKSINITVGNQAPSATITSPASGSLYTPGQTVQLNGQATDPEDGNLAAGAYHWQIILHHNTHIHYQQEFVGVTNPSFVADDHNDPSVYMEIILTVTDSVGLQSTDSINMYVNNGSGSGNLITNPSVEIEDTLPNHPTSWHQGWFGEMNPIFTYPVAGLNGEKAMKLEINSYTSGDAKWYFDPVSVSSGQTYNFSSYYTSTVETEQVAQFGYANGTYSYLPLGELPAAAAAALVEHQISIPTGVQTLAVFHQLAGVGILVTDNFSLTLATPAPDTTPPTVSITSPADNATISTTINITADAADDVGVVGVTFKVDGNIVGTEDTSSPYSLSFDSTTLTDGAHTITATARDAAGNTTISSVVNVMVDNVPNNLIVNGDMEIENGTNPANWTPVGWGTHTRVFTYPVTGFDGNKAAGVEITSYALSDDGDSRWVFDTVPVTPGNTYKYSDRFKSNIISDVIGKYVMQDGGNYYFGLIKEIPASPSWNYQEASFTAPTNAVSLTILHLISSVGFLEIDDVVLVQTGTATPPETEAPVVVFTNPLEGVTVSGIVNLAANATDNVGVTGVQFAVNGNPFGPQLTAEPYQINWDSATVANGEHFLKVTAHDAVGNNSNQIIAVVVNNVPDTTPPTVSITSPADNATISTTINITADAADDVGVVGVTFKVDGNIVGTEDTSSPYSLSFDSTTLTDGAHTITATARDAAGNTTISSVVNVMVDNVPDINNLILNPSLEIVGSNGDPENWFKGGWGSNDRVHTYPIAGQEGTSAARVEITNYTDGDAKWFFENVDITPGQLYTLTHYYKASTATNLTLRYTLDSGAFQYAGLGNIPAASNWTLDSLDITAPANAVSVTLFHSLISAGWLEVDNYSLHSGSLDTFDKGKVSLTFDDGWLSHYTNALPILDAENVKGGFYIISEETVQAAPVELITNPSLETVGSNGDPVGWLRGGWGTNDRVLTYPVAGVDGASAAKVAITSYTSGDAKWYFSDVHVIADNEYTVSNRYNSTAPTEVLARYTLSGGVTQYVFLEILPSTGGAWGSFNRTITTPLNAVSLTLFHVLAQVGELSVDNYSLERVQVFADPTQMLAFQTSGHEVGSHTRTHPYLTQISAAQQQDEIVNSRTSILGMGINTVNTFVYPYGDYNADVQSITQGGGYIGARSTDRGFNLKSTDKYALKIQQVDRTVTMTDIQTWTEEAEANNTWLILVFHQIDEDASATLGTTPALLQQMVQYIKTQNVDILTMRQGLGLMNP